MEEEANLRHPFDIAVAAITVDEFCSRIISWAKSRTGGSRLITYLNAHCVNVFFRDPEYAGIVRSADLVYADGQSLVWASRLLKEALPERISAGDFMSSFCARCRDLGLSLYFLGSEKDIANRAALSLEKEHPGLKIAGAHDGFFAREQASEIVAEINEACPDILLIGMGVPLQEKFADKNAAEIRAPVIWCVGALFEYFAGTTPRAPRWMRRIGMEWLFRLAENPRRLWRRYLLGNAAFIITTLRHLSRKA